MVDERLAGPCGIFCGDCEYLGGSCSGCGSVEGKPFWTRDLEMDACPLYACCVGGKGLEHCGLCGELPCELFRGFHDPALSPEEAERSVRERISALEARRDEGTRAWLARLERRQG